MTFAEYPKWVRRSGHPDVHVDSAEQEEQQIRAWDAADEIVSPPGSGNALMRSGDWTNTPLAPGPFNGADPAKFDHDGNGQPGGSKPRGWPKGKPRKKA